MTDPSPSAAGSPSAVPRSLRLDIPACPEFEPLVRTACRIMARALPGGEALVDRIQAALGDPVAAAIAGADERVAVEVSLASGQLEVIVNSGRGRSIHRFPPSQD